MQEETKTGETRAQYVARRLRELRDGANAMANDLCSHVAALDDLSADAYRAIPEAEEDDEADEDASAEACAAATLEYARKRRHGPDTLTYRDGVRDALSGFHDPRAVGVHVRDLTGDYLSGRDVAAGVKASAQEPQSPESHRDYWTGFLAALRLDRFNDLDPSDWYVAGVEDGNFARERIDAGGVIGAYTESDRGYHYTSYRVAVYDSDSDRHPNRTLGPFADFDAAREDRDALRATGHAGAKVEGQQYDTGIGGGSGQYPPLRVWVEIESL